MKYIILSMSMVSMTYLSYGQSITIFPDSTQAVNLRGFGWISPVKVSDVPNAILPAPTLPVQGEGTRMMWIPSRSAFRVGTLENRNGNEANFWNTSNIGLFSFSGGYNTLASGRCGVALGFNSQATGHISTAFGYYNLASGAYTLASGLATAAHGEASTSMGIFTNASSYASVAIGRWNANPSNINNTQWIATDPLFMAGNGSASNATSNAMVLYKNGNMTIAGSLSQSSDLRLKKEVKTLVGISAKLMQLRGVSYRFDLSKRTNMPEGNQIGFIAQEVENLFPELVFTDGDGYKSVDYARLTPLLLEALKDLTLRVQKIESQIVKTVK